MGRGNWLYLALFAVFFPAVFFVLGTTLPSFCDHPSSQAAQEYCAQYSPYEAAQAAFAHFLSWFGDSTNINMLAALVIATFTVVLAFVTNRQAKFTRDSIDLTRKQFADEQRPWLALKLRRAKQVPTGNIGNVNIELRSFNSGRTPALGAHFYSKLVRVKGLYGPDADYAAYVVATLAEYASADKGDDVLAKRRGATFPGQTAVIGPFDQIETFKELPPVLAAHYHLFCCLCYQAPNSDSVLHTGAVYHLELKIRGDLTEDGFSFKSGDEKVAFNLMGINSAT